VAAGRVRAHDSPASSFPRHLPDPARGKAAEDSMSEHIKHTSDASFDSDVLNAEVPVLVDYWAEWCGPCKGIAPILEELSKEYTGRLTVAKMNVDENQTTPVKYNIRAIPTLMLFKNGAVVGTKVGQLSKSQLTAFIDSNI
jgi:thioredoxin 1